MKQLVVALAMSFWIAAPAYSAKTPNVSVSIKPIHSLVAMVMRGVGEPHLIMQGHASPHTYALKPSDAAALQSADIVFRIGPDMETFLNGPLETLGDRSRTVDLASVEGLLTLGFRPAGVFHGDHSDGNDHEGHEGHDDHADSHEHESDDHGHKHIRTTFDMHIWLDPENAHLMIDHIADVMGALDPDNADTYSRNAKSAAGDLEALVSELRTALEPVHEKRFLVFHDAYHYFEKRFGLHAAGSITLNPQNPPGAETLAELNDLADRGGIVCAFVEPQFSPKLIEAIAGKTKLQVGTLDPLGASIDAGLDHYTKTLRAMAASFRDCLGD